MNLASFFAHWSVLENPFRGEEARQDVVFSRLVHTPRADALDGERPGARTMHSDFDKIAGDFHRPSASIVFGEKGSGKTAIRLQLARRIADHNTEHPASKALLIAYDDLGPFLDRFCARMSEGRGEPPLETLRRIRLVDHIDAILLLAVPRFVDAALGQPAGPDAVDMSPDPRRVVRRLEPALRRDLLVLQAVYDRPAEADARTPRLASRLGLRRPGSVVLWNLLAAGGWVLSAGIGLGALLVADGPERSWLGIAALGTLAAWLLTLLKRGLVDRFALMRTARRLRRQLRVSGRTDASYARSMRRLDPAALDSATVPLTDSDEPRFEMLARLRRLAQACGYASVVVVVDRVDEPTVLSGDADRMRAVVWPLLSNKFLQLDGYAIKLLLPAELRHQLFRESSAFFQEARLDKQNLVERLAWTGAMLYDLCNARLNACRPQDAPPIALLDLFAEDVTRQDLVDALDQMHQPRDAFKLLYECFTEHCSNVTEDQAAWRVPRLILETVRKRQAERVRQLYLGVRPA